ncbi:MAG: hypothetical protein CMF59_00480 [Leptospiraceae bacterium]|nr:hypothetical protein [Leptospiraceae bacterium]
MPLLKTSRTLSLTLHLTWAVMPGLTLTTAGCSTMEFAQQVITVSPQGTDHENHHPQTDARKCQNPTFAPELQGELSLKLVHGNRVIPVKPGSEITISDTRFALLFNMADYDLFCDRYAAARVMASENADFIENIVEPPFEIGDTTFLGAGWSMATDMSMRYDTLFLTEGGMHYLILNVDGEPIEQRLSIQRTLGPHIYEMRWDIYSIARMDSESVKPLGREKTTFAMLFFRDSDLDDVVETGEFLVFYITVDPAAE